MDLCLYHLLLDINAGLTQQGGQMTTTEAIQTLTEYQSWRRGAETPMQDPLTIREAIDKAIEVMQHLPDPSDIFNVEQAACDWLKDQTAKGADHWSFKQGANWMEMVINQMEDVCPRCGSDKIVVTIYCNSCHQAH